MSIFSTHDILNNGPLIDKQCFWLIRKYSLYLIAGKLNSSLLWTDLSHRPSPKTAIYLMMLAILCLSVAVVMVSFPLVLLQVMCTTWPLAVVWRNTIGTTSELFFRTKASGASWQTTQKTWGWSASRDPRGGEQKWWMDEWMERGMWGGWCDLYIQVRKGQKKGKE